MNTYRPGGFKPADARAWDGRPVNLTTHPGDKAGEGNETFTGVRFLYISGKNHAMLAQRRPDGHVEGVGGVFLWEVATIEEATA